MAWSQEQADRDQVVQWAWVDSWPGWDEIPEVHAGSGWNALHEQGGGGWPAADHGGLWTAAIPSRYFEPGGATGDPVGGWS